MGIRSGAEYRESLRDGRSIYVDGERVTDVTAYPPFQGAINTLAMLYDLQHDPQHQSLLTYPSPADGQPVSLSFLITDTAQDVDRRVRAEEFRAEATFGLMGRLPDFMNALVTDAAVAHEFIGQRNKQYGANTLRYYEDCRDRDWCLTHTLVDPQIDRSKGPAEQADPEAALHRVRETDRGLVVRGARMLSTLAPFSNELWVGPFYPRKPGDEAYALCFAVPMDIPGLKFVCREAYSTGRSDFDRPLSSRFDEEDALAIFDDVEVPWERVFINGDIEASNYILGHAPGYALLQGVIRGTVKLRFMAGLACSVAEAIGRTAAPACPDPARRADRQCRDCQRPGASGRPGCGRRPARGNLAARPGGQPVGVSAPGAYAGGGSPASVERQRSDSDADGKGSAESRHCAVSRTVPAR